MDLLLKHLGKHEISDYVNETVRKHIGSPHIGGLSPSRGSHQSDAFVNGLHENLGQMNLGDRFQPANVNFSLDYQPPRQTYPPNSVREDVAPQRYQPRVSGVWGRDQDRQVRQPQRDITKKVKVNAPEFDGRMDPNVFSDWLVAIEEYFDWYEMIDSERVRFAKMKLTNSAKMYWQNVLQDMLRLGEPPITQWAVMKAKLQDKYIPPSYKSQFFSTMINLKQMTLSVADYSSKFEEARLRCSEFHAEDQFAVCTRFVNGLRFDIQRMVRLHAPHTVEDAYQKALEVEKFNRPSSFAHTGQSKSQSMSFNGYSPRTPIDLVHLPPHMRVSEPAETFATHIHDLHAEIRRKISLSNEEYKLAADVHRRSKEFNVGDHVMVRIRPERIPKTFSKKLYARAMAPYSIIRKMGSIAYLLDLPNDMDISPVFNIEDLLPYRGTFEPSTLPSSVSAGDASKGAPTVPSLQFSKETVDTILDDEFMTSRDGGFRRFLVKWHGRPDSDATWIQEDDLRHLDSSLLDCYLSFHSSESSSFQPGGNDGAWSRPLYKPKRDRKPKSNEDFYYY